MYQRIAGDASPEQQQRSHRRLSNHAAEIITVDEDRQVVQENNTMEIWDEDRGGEPSVQSSWLSTLFNLTNTAIGAGTLALPYTFRECGLGLGVFLVVLVGWLSWYGLHFLNLCSSLQGLRWKSSRLSFLGVAKSAYGKRGEQWLSNAMFLMLMGPLSAYFNIVGTYLRAVVETLEMNQHADMWYTSRLFLMSAVGCGVMFPLSCLKSLQALSFASLVALFAMFYAVLLIPFSYVRDVRNPNWEPPRIHLWYRLGWKVASSFATIGMAYINHAVLIESTAEMKKPTGRRKFLLIACSSSIVTIVYLMVSTVGYLHYGDAVEGNILNSEPNDALFTSARLAVAIVIALSYPLLAAPARLCLDWILSEWFRTPSPTAAHAEDDHRSDIFYPDALGTNVSEEEGPRWQWIRQRILHAPSWDWNDPVIANWRFYAETVFIFVLSFVIAVLIPGLDKIFALFGAIGGSLVIYIFPAMFFRKMALQQGILVGSGHWFPRRRKSVGGRVGTAQLDFTATTLKGDQPGFENLTGDMEAVPSSSLYETPPQLLQQQAEDRIMAPAFELPPTPSLLTLTMIYVNVVVGALLFVVGSGFALYDILIGEPEAP